MPKKHAVLSLHEQATIAASMLLLESADNMIKYANRYEVDPQLKRAKLMSSVQQVKQYFCSSIPQYLQTRISLFCLKMLIFEVGHEHQNDSYHLVVLLAKTMLNIRDLSDISFYNFPFNVDETLFRHLPCMAKLTYLNLTNYSIEFPRFAKFFEQGLLNITNLLEFSFEKCTDSIIQRIAFSCKRIRKIDVTDSLRVTDACIPTLCLCEDLQEFHCFNTAVTRRGYEKLLIYHPRLHIIDLIFIECCDDSDNHYFKSSTLFKKNKTLNMENLHELNKMHPHIKCLRISLLECNHLSILHWFPNVDIVDIMWYNYEYYFDSLCDALKVRGSTFTSLNFDESIIDIDTLFIINQYCPNLITLDFTKARIEDTASIEEWRSERFKPFQSVLNITVTITFAAPVATRQFMKYLLSHSINVKFLYVQDFEFDDELLQEILALNPMKQLEKLTLDKTHLTMNSVNLLMEYCDNLWYLPELDTWNIEHEEMNNFLLYLKRNNIRLITTYDKNKDGNKFHNALHVLNS